MSRTRTEQRFFDIPGSSDVGHRFRQMIKISIPMPTVSPKVSLVAFDEIFINLTAVPDLGRKAGFNKNRIFAGFAYKFNDVATGEIGYLNQILNRPNSPRPDQMQHILSVNLLLNFQKRNNRMFFHQKTSGIFIFNLYNWHQNNATYQLVQYYYIITIE